MGRSLRTTRTAEVITLVVASLALTGCRGGSTQIGAGSQLPDRVLISLRKDVADSGMGRATSVDWVLTTHGKAATITGGADPSDPTPIYLFDVHGKFVWNHSCPYGAPRSACVSVGTDQVFTSNPQSLEVVDLTVMSHSPDLSHMGEHGHVTL